MTRSTTNLLCKRVHLSENNKLLLIEPVSAMFLIIHPFKIYNTSF
jgi:hypothetical protein